MTPFPKRNPAVVLLLSFVTCGIYAYYLIYQISKEIRDYTNDSSINPGVELLLCIITCGLYMFYWFYKFGSLVVTMQQNAGMQNPSCNPIILLLLPILGLSPVSLMLLQSEMNHVWDIVFPDGGASSGAASQSFNAAGTSNTNSGTASFTNTAPDAQNTGFSPAAAPVFPTAPEAPVRTCSGCGAELPPDVKFCPVCGQKVEEVRYCKGCGEPLPEGVKFCPKCGYKAD